MSVATDARGRVYVADYHNDRIQVFTPSAEFIKAIKIKKPAEVRVHQKSGEMYVASWMMIHQYSKPKDVEKPVLTRLGPLDAPSVKQVWPLPLVGHSPNVFMNKRKGLQWNFALDSWTSPPTIWLVPASMGAVDKLAMVRGKMNGAAAAGHIRLYVPKGKKLEQKRHFGEEAAKAVLRTKPAIHARQKLYVNPVNGKLYVFEGQAGVSKSALSLLEIDPSSATYREKKLPFDAEDCAFDMEGLIYLRTDNVVGRFQPKNWREIPFDYGEERMGVGFTSGRGGRQRNLISALAMPAQRPGCFHQGGLAVSPKGHLVVPCYNRVTPVNRKAMGEIQAAARIKVGQAYTPKMYPGRKRWNEVHVWDKHGQLLFEDAVPGAPMMDGIAMDQEDNLYLLASPNRMYNGKAYFLERAETLVKARPGETKFVNNAAKGVPVPLPKAAHPKRPPDADRKGQYWIQGSEWLYGGVGFGGFNSSKGGGGCACWSARFALDYFARSFAPEVDHFSVAVLDKAGNLILRVGRYGNADDGKPLIAAGASPVARSLGGDEVALFDAAYLAVHSDRRLFVADGGNARILSVKLNYHKEAVLFLKEIPGRLARKP